MSYDHLTQTEINAKVGEWIGMRFREEVDAIVRESKESGAAPVIDADRIVKAAVYRLVVDDPDLHRRFYLLNGGNGNPLPILVRLQR